LGHLFDLVRHGEPRVLQGRPSRPGETPIVEAVAFAPDALSFATGCETTFRLWETSTGRLIREVPGCTASVQGIVFSQDGETLATVDSEGTVALWKASTGEQNNTAAAHTGPSFGLALSPDGKLLATVGVTDLTLRVWNSRTLEPIATYRRAKVSERTD
jgi:WD40 repeat protein